MTPDELFERLKHPNPNLRQQAMIELAEVRDETTIPRLMSVLDQEDVTYRRAAVLALGVIGADAVPAIVAELQASANVTVRSSCAKALAQIAVNYPENAFPAAGLAGLKLALGDDNPVVYIASAMALGEMGQPALPILEETLRATDNVAAQVSIVNALAAVGGDGAAAVLLEFSTDETADSYVRETAVSALSRLEMVKNNQHPGR
jgi:bilin biosynthesis protein